MCDVNALLKPLYVESITVVLHSSKVIGKETVTMTAFNSSVAVISCHFLSVIGRALKQVFARIHCLWQGYIAKWPGYLARYRTMCFLFFSSNRATRAVDRSGEGC